MADPITWGLINIVKKGVRGVQTTLDGVKNSVDTLPEDVQTKLDAFEVTIDELKKNVEDTLADVQETVENSPAGIPAPPLLSMSAQSTENGIKVTYKPSIFFGRSSNSFVVAEMDSYDQLFSLTKGVMIRYSNESFPLTPKDGILAVIDEDIFTVDNAGEKTAKQKTYEIVGLSNGETYYISAFPYSTNNLYNLSSGTNTKNRVKCRWIGTKGTLTVNVTQDIDYKALGEYTATMTPTAGGEAVTKTQSGPATIIFSGLEAGQYQLSFSAATNFTKPSNKSITITAGQSQTVSAEYVFKPASLSASSWSDIKAMSQRGYASKYWNYGDTKSVNLSGIGTFNFQYSGTFGARMVFASEKCIAEKVFSSNGNSYPFSYVGSDIQNYIENDLYNALPSDLKSVITPRNISYATKGSYEGSFSTQSLSDQKLWLLSTTELFGSNLDSYHKPAMDSGYQLEYFTSDSRRVKNGPNTDYGMSYWTRSLNYFYNGHILNMVHATGVSNSNNCIDKYGVVVAFLV